MREMTWWILYSSRQLDVRKQSRCQRHKASVTRWSSTNLPCVVVSQRALSWLEEFGRDGEASCGVSRVLGGGDTIHANCTSWSRTRCCAITPAGTFAVAVAAPHFLVANDPVFAASRENRTHTYTPQRRV
jgi:hypothetical protein